VHKLVLTASGGPFRGKTRKDLDGITVQQAMAHPTWSMGQVVTINSANLVNKGLELIEAHLLFGVPYDRIDVVVHPQSIIHSMVTFTDGSTLAQASPPDMRLPISLGLGWPERVAGAARACTFDTATSWTFEPVDSVTFPAVELARQAGSGGGCLPAIYNAANEEALAAFVAGDTSFLSIVDTIGQVLGEASDWRSDPADVAEVLAAEDWARARARELVGRN
jgi:1-deoxy-D-xylulose-5-phosphate reductoisomerase